MLFIKAHGGGCCGMSHIYGFGIGDSTKVKDPALGQGCVMTGAGNYYGPAPAETKLARLRRMIKHLEARRPHGIIEIVLSDFSSSYGKGKGNIHSQVRYWRRHLTRLKFKEVNRFLNSNSGNTDYIFHRHIPKVPKKKSKKTVSLRSAG